VVLSVVRPVVGQAVVDLHGIAVEPDPLLDKALAGNVIEHPLQGNRLRIYRFAVVRMLDYRGGVAVPVARTNRVP
jgi:hypothetical protein